MRGLRLWCACACVVAGSGALSFALLTYRLDAEQNERLTGEVARALDAVVADPIAGPADRSRENAPRPPRVANPRLHVRAPREGQALGLIDVPSIGLTTAFFEGVAESTLHVGPGHLPWTAAPGSGGVSVISAHRDRHFSPLKDIRFGDRIEMVLPWARQTYRVDDLAVIGPDDLDLAWGRTPELVLLTCWPPQFVGPAPDRLVVHASLERSRPIVTAERTTRRGGGDASPTSPAPVAAPVRVALPVAVDPVSTTVLPFAGSSGIAVAALATFAALHSRRRGPWFGAFLGGGAVLAATLLVGLAR